jgi:glycosyltransferase involved in cell wall biosynthesis
VTLGFACHWGPDRTRTWSGTPLHLLHALQDRTEVVDLDLSLGRPARTALRLAGVRRVHGRWTAPWRHGRAGLVLVERHLTQAARTSGAEVVFEVGDLGYTEQPYLVYQDLSYDVLLEQFQKGGSIPHFRFLTGRDLRRLRARQLRVYDSAAGVVVMSRWVADHIVRAGVAADRVHVVPPGVNVDIDDSPLPERRQGGRARMLFVGRDFDTKGGEQVVLAFERVRRDLGPRAELTVAGPTRWPLGSVPDGVRFLGPVPPSRIRSLYEEHDLLVMPSLFEGFGIVFAEALGRGMPCIGRDACAMPEIIDKESGGRLVTSGSPGELADLMLDALADDELYSRCAQAAASRRAYYSWERAAGQVFEVVTAAAP